MTEKEAQRALLLLRALERSSQFKGGQSLGAFKIPKELKPMNITELCHKLITEGADEIIEQETEFQKRDHQVKIEEAEQSLKISELQLLQMGIDIKEPK